jgi:hypothetical protein
VTGEPVRAPVALPGATGTRARSRELGYAEAMEGMWHMLRDMEDDYEARAKSERNSTMAFALTYAAWLLGTLGSYAYSAHRVHDTHPLKHGLGGELHYTWKRCEAPKEPAAETRTDHGDQD